MVAQGELIFGEPAWIILMLTLPLKHGKAVWECVRGLGIRVFILVSAAAAALVEYFGVVRVDVQLMTVWPLVSSRLC